MKQLDYLDDDLYNKLPIGETCKDLVIQTRFICFSKTFTDLSIDLSSFIPVLKIIGFLNEQICSKSGMLLHSPEPILNIF